MVVKLLLLIGLVAGGGLIMIDNWGRGEIVRTSYPTSSVSEALVMPPAEISRFEENFERNGAIEEVGKMSESSSDFWWVNSGGQLVVRDGVGSTLQGEASAENKWRLLYKKNNPGGTDNGAHPQNIFRLVTKSTWLNLRQQVYFRIIKYYPSESVHRQESNGVLLFNRYLDGDNLYYAGLRVDGAVVIKKKVGGRYFTLQYTKVLAGEYDRRKHPNLLPVGRWIGLKTEVANEPSGDVRVKLFVDWDKSGGWEQVAQVVDDGKTYGDLAIKEVGYGGIRSDFMDAEFDDYEIEEMSH